MLIKELTESETWKCEEYIMCAINDQLGQTHSPAINDHYLFSPEICFVLWDFEKKRMDGHYMRK